MNAKERLKKLESIVGTVPKDDGPTLSERVAAMLADPAAVERQLAWDEKYLSADSPFSIMEATDRGAAIEAALQADPPDSPGFQPWTPTVSEAGGLGQL